MKICVVSTKDFSYPAGGQAVAIHLLDVLKSNHDVTFVHFNKKVDWRALNTFYGTNLSKGEVTGRYLGKKIPLHNVRLWYVKKHIAMRFAKKHRKDFDVFFSTSGELDFGKKGIQWINLPMPNIFNRRSATLLGRLNTMVCNLLSKASIESMKKNYTISNSHWVAERVKETYNIESTVVFPPIKEFGVSTDFNFSEWQKRDNGFVSIGRISRDKRIEESIKILEAVRRHDKDITFTIAGNVRDKEYYNELKALAKERPWISFHIDLQRKDLENLILKNKFGVHAKLDERFGIAVAEMVYGGLLTFVPNGGGQVEIVNSSPSLIYDSPDEAVEKIISMLDDSDLQSKQFSELLKHRNLFTVSSFQKSIVSIVESFEK